MDSQVEYPPGVGPHKEVEGEEYEEQKQGKKSVLKKVKDKAKKIKETLTKQTNSHGRRNGSGDHIPDDHDLDEEDDEDEEMVEPDQQPEIHGAPIYGSTEGRDRAVGRFGSDWKDPSISSNKYGSDLERVGKVNLREPINLEDDPHAPKDPADPGCKRSQQVKAADPAGHGSTEETGVNPLIRSFEKMNVNPEPELQQSLSPKQFTDRKSGSGSHFSTEPAFRTGADSSMPPEKMETEDHSTNQSSYTQKISAATSAITDRAISVKNIVASKLGYGEKDNQTDSHEGNPDSPGEYGNKFSTATSAITDRAISAKNAVASKLGYGEKSKEEETQKENSAISAIADKAVSAKNVVASKLDYGEKDTERETHEVEGVKQTSASPVEYGKKVATTVYKKVAGAGTNVASKMRGEGENKGVSVKDYISDKLKPGEEDKALSEIISGALHKSKEEEVDRPVGKVTESEEVRKRLGDEDEGCESGENLNVTSKGMVGKIKDTVGSWMAKSGPELQVSPQSISSSQGRGNSMEKKEGEDSRVLQESTY